MSQPTAEQFLSAFLDAYERSRGFFTDDAWEVVWKTRWNDFMLWKNGKPPEPLDKSVLHQTSEKLNLDYWPGEPLTVDGAFFPIGSSPVGNLPFPILIAIEHENDHRGFNNEIAKLMSIRCPLKVGITYTVLWGAGNTASNRQRVLDLLRQQICDCHSRISQVVGEDPTTEYLFLVGTENPSLVLTWRVMTFPAAQGPQGREFVSR